MKHRRVALLAPLLLWIFAGLAASPSWAGSPGCAGDCNGDGQVRVDELILGVNRALGTAGPEICAAVDDDENGEVTVDELVRAVRNALAGCGADLTATPTASPFASPTPTPTAPSGPSWTALAPMPRARQEIGVTELDGWVYAIGGLDATGRVVDTVEVYDPVANEWHTVAPLPERLHHVAAASAAGRVFALGGLESPDFNPVSAVFAYDPETDMWEARAPLPNPRGAAAAAVIDGLIYLAGGLRDGPVDDFTVYDPDLDTWEELTPMPTSRDHLGAAAIGGFFYAVGGRSGGIFSVLSTVEQYDPGTGQWNTNVAPLPTGRGGLAVAVLAGRIFAAGGEGNPGRPDFVFPHVEAYDPLLDSWGRLPDLPTPRHGMGAAAVGDAVIVPGGATVAGFGASAANEALVLD